MAVKGSYRVPSGVAHTQVLHRRVPRVGPGRRVVFYGIEIEMKQAVPVAGLSLGQADIRHHALQRLQGGVLRIEHLIEQIGRRGVTAHILRVKGYRPGRAGRAQGIYRPGAGGRRRRRNRNVAGSVQLLTGGIGGEILQHGQL